MDKTTYEAIVGIISARIVTAFNHLDNDHEYQTVCEQQEITKKSVEDIYHEQLEKDERLFVRRHYEGEIHKNNFELNESYIQGLRDCFCLIGFLNGNGEYSFN